MKVAMRSEILAAVNMKIVMPCSLIDGSQHFLGICCLHLQDKVCNLRSLRTFQRYYLESIENSETAFWALCSCYSAMKWNPSSFKYCQLWNWGVRALHISVPLAPLLYDAAISCTSHETSAFTLGPVRMAQPWDWSSLVFANSNVLPISVCLIFFLQALNVYTVAPFGTGPLFGLFESTCSKQCTKVSSQELVSEVIFVKCSTHSRHHLGL
jgi:hypothetical protein